MVSGSKQECHFSLTLLLLLAQTKHVREMSRARASSHKQDSGSNDLGHCYFIDFSGQNNYTSQMKI